MPPPRLNHRPAPDRRLFKQLDRERQIRHTKTGLEQLVYWWQRVSPSERLEFLRWIPRIG
jgi:uncharacterized protein YccT (UPF0319 family)